MLIKYQIAPRSEQIKLANESRNVSPKYTSTLFSLEVVVATIKW